jgi:Ser/Thr protein kinase RdoA (MazF antagonist)
MPLGFSSPAVLHVLHRACHQAGLSSDGAVLLRFGENAIYRLAADPVVVRIARSADRLAKVERELCVARWLAAANVPAVRVIEEIDQPLKYQRWPWGSSAA